MLELLKPVELSYMRIISFLALVQGATSASPGSIRLSDVRISRFDCVSFLPRVQGVMSASPGSSGPSHLCKESPREKTYGSPSHGTLSS